MVLPLLSACCAGLDIHKQTVVACVLLTAPSGKVTKAIRTFATTMASWQQLADWLESFGVTHVASASFIPPKPIRDLQDLVRARKTLL